MNSYEDYFVKVMDGTYSYVYSSIHYSNRVSYISITNAGRKAWNEMDAFVENNACFSSVRPT